MKLLLGCVAAVAVASVGACAGEGDKPVSLAGVWKGTVTCYSMDSPLQMTIDKAAPTKATVAMGDGGALAWDAAVAFDAAKNTVSIAADNKMSDAALLAGTLDGDVLSGEIEKQLCNSFTLTRQP